MKVLRREKGEVMRQKIFGKRQKFDAGKLMQSGVIRICVFILVGLGLLSRVSTVMSARAADQRTYENIRGFYEQEEGSLDAIYLGSSVTYTDWLAPLAWERYGITVWPFASPSQPFEIAEELIKEARKTQPDALYIVPLITLKSSITDVVMHHSADGMKLSWNKIQLVRKVGDYMDLDWTEQLEYLFPIIRYHSRWNELDEEDFDNTFEELKGSYHKDKYFLTTDISSRFRTTERTGRLYDITQDALENLLEYCDTEQLNVLFLHTPYWVTNENSLAQINTIKETVRARGYPVLDLQSAMEEISLDLTKDYFDNTHPNIHGAIKLTDYISRYLVENYNFEDKRGDPSYNSWDEAYAAYTKGYASSHVLDVEWGGEPRDSALAAPELKTAVKGEIITVSWNAVPDADGYRIYRKDALDSSWQAVDTVDADTLSCDDSGREAGSTYYYTVVAYREEDGVRYWGGYNFAGVTGKALLNAPELISLEGSENDLTLTWGTVEGADGYAVYRKLPSKSWFQIADVGDVTTFTDTNMLSDMPYQYSVKAYYIDEAGSSVMGSYDTIGLLYAPKLAPLTMEAAAEEDGAICLSWKRIEGIQGYTVYRRTQDSSWERITTGNLDKDSVGFRDITAQKGIHYAYKAEAYIRVGDQERVYELEAEPEWMKTDKAVYKTAMPKIVYLEQTWNQVHIVWEKAKGASSYRVYRRTLDSNGNWGEWKSVKSSVTGTSYLDTPPSVGEYQYLVQALFARDGLTYYGEFNGKTGYGVIYSAIS